MEIPLKNKMIKAALTWIAAALIYLIGCFCTPFGWAKNIQVEAETSILAEFSGDDGGWLGGTLVDNLNHPLPNQTLQIHITQTNHAYAYPIFTADFELTTDDNGHFEQDLSLPASDESYHIVTEYKGNMWYRSSEHSIDSTISNDCTLDYDVFIKDNSGDYRSLKTIPDSQTLFIHSSIPLKLKIQPRVIHCRQSFKNYSFLVSCRQDAVRADIPSDNNEIEIELHPEVFTNHPSIDELNIYITNLSKRELNFKTVNTSFQVVYFNKLLKDMAVLSPGYIKFEFIDEVLPYIHNKYSVVDGQKMMLCTNDNNECNSVDPYHENSKHLLYPFNQMFSNHTRGLFYSNSILIQSFDFSQNQVLFDLDDTDQNAFTLNQVIGVSLGGTVCLGVIFFGIYYIRQNRRKKLPKNPDKLRSLSTQVEEWPDSLKDAQISNIHTTNLECLYIFVDAHTRQPIPLQQLTLLENHVERQIDSWPCITKCHTKIELNHPDYISWKGSFEHPGKHIISLVSRRQYVIECFEAVCQSVIGKPLPWGKTTPQELCQMAKNSSKYRESLYKYCTMIERATFGDMGLDDVALKEIRHQTMIVIKQY